MKYFVFLIFLFFLAGCSSLEKQENPIFKDVRELLPYFPDSACRYMELNRKSFITSKDKAVATLTEYYINDLKGYGFRQDSLAIDIIRNSHHYTDNYYMVLACYYKGVYLINKSDYEKAIELLHAATQFAVDLRWDHMLGMIYNKYAELFYQLNLYKTSISYADKSFDHFTISEDCKQANRSLACKIFSLIELGDNEAAVEYYRAAKKYALDSGDIVFFTRLCAEQLSIFLFQGDDLRAESIYNDLAENKNGDFVFPIELLYEINKYIKTLQLDSAYHYLTKADRESTDYYDRILLKYFFSRYYRATKDYGSAFDYTDEYLRLSDSIINLTQRTSLVKLESYSQNLQTELKYEKKIAGHRRLFYSGIIVFFLLAAIFFLYRNKAKRQRNELNKRIAVVSEIVSNLKRSHQTLLSRLDVHKEKENRLKEHIESKLAYAKMFSDFYYRFQNKPGTILKKMNEFIDLMPMNSEFTTSIIQNVNQYYNNALEKLTLKHPDLTNAEILFSSMIIAGFSMQEMSLILSCNSVDAVYMRKHRLKQKLSLPKDINVEDYLAGFAGE